MADHLSLDDHFSLLEADIFSGQLLPSAPWTNLDLDDAAVREPSAAPGANAASSGFGSGSDSHKKLSHNAYERDRRKQLNELYLALRSLLPDADHTKKLSIPTTVCRVLKYIPDLQRQVKSLEKKKKELADAAKCIAAPGVVPSKVAPAAVSATCLNDEEIVVQVGLLRSNVMDAAGGTTLPMSKCIKALENEGLHLINSSTFSAPENRMFYSLHLQRSEGALSEECPAFCDKLEQVVKKTAGII